MVNSHDQDDREDSQGLLLPTCSVDASDYETSLVEQYHDKKRLYFDPRKFFPIIWRSSCTASMAVNILWPVVPVALCLNAFGGKSLDTVKFALTMIAVVPAANLLGFAANQVGARAPPVVGIIIETAFGSVVEIAMLLVLVVRHGGNNGQDSLFAIIQAAILGSIITNLLLCLGLCFFFGGLRHESQTFHPVVSEAGTGVLLVAAFGLMIPSAFFSALKSSAVSDAAAAEKGLHRRSAQVFTEHSLDHKVLSISRYTSIALIIAFIMYTFYQLRSHHETFDEVLKEEHHFHNAKAAANPKMALRHHERLTMTESVIAIVIAIVLVTFLLIFLINGIEHIVELGVPDQFLGLILLPLVEKAAEHLTAIDEAKNGAMNIALYHCLGPSVQTALFNAPIVILIAWMLGKPLNLNFEIFMIALLILSILVVSNFLRDGESTWLEDALLVNIYIIIAIGCFFYPNPHVASSNGPSVADHAAAAAPSASAAAADSEHHRRALEAAVAAMSVEARQLLRRALAAEYF